MAAQAGKKKRGKFFSYTKALVFDRSMKYFCVLKCLKLFDFSFFYLSKKKGTKCHLRLLFCRKRECHSLVPHTIVRVGETHRTIFPSTGTIIILSSSIIAFPLLLNIQGKIGLSLHKYNKTVRT